MGDETTLLPIPAPHFLKYLMLNAIMISHEQEISNLIFHYNELIDAGDLKGAAALFKNAQLKFPGTEGLKDHNYALDLFEKIIIVYPDGTPRTRHIVTNLIIEISEDNRHAQARSLYTVYQATEELPLQAVAIGHYIDRFSIINEKWHFTYRDYSYPQLSGNISKHLRF